MIAQLFFELIRVSIGTQVTLSKPPSAEEWKELYAMAKKQSLVGICFAGVQKASPQPSPEGKGEKSLPSGGDLEEVYIPEMLYLTWMGMAAKIQQRNEFMNVKTKVALTFFREKGFPCQVLKGQGIAPLYGSLSGLRQSGDIDVWAAGGREKIYQLSREVLGKITGANYHHIHFPMWEDTSTSSAEPPEIELHIYPSFLSSPLRNRRLQNFCKQHEPYEGCGHYPSLEFNRIFILLHCYRHLSGHGVGMRQLMDYYFVLRAEVISESTKQQVMNVVESLGMKRFAHAVMWFMKNVFGLEDEYLICEPNEKDGRFLLSEVMMTGNMGHADKRLNKKLLQSALGRYIYNRRRDMQIVRICPHEAMWQFAFSIYLFIWKKIKGL